ncbi:hypothetical protein KJF94_04325 [Pseudomonas hormoni]|uniref:Ig-like domain repeat protein n=1 Tax=Pseudomonas hormoni TaxID=3093767 RepID=A0ABX8F1Q6_9PSED|nr:hypothetical protein [Pseudomonas hormoni]QVW24817.1 hypothetical protein KJF94_04325 [Pseudomonas hormoni]
MTDFPSNNLSQTTNDLVDENLLTVSKILDRNGVSIGRTTYETAIKVSGINAEPKNKVWIMNGNEELGEATTGDSGEWESPLLDLKHFDCYKVRAVGQWSPNPSSLPRNFTAATRTPIINEVLSDGKPIADNDTISTTEVTFFVNAIPSQNARLFNGEDLLKTEPTNNCGKCTFVLTDLEPATYRIKVKATNDNESTVFNFTVKEDVTTPVTLDKVTDLDGNEIGKNTTTSKTSLYVEGEGKKDEKVEIFNGTDSLGEATVDAAGRYKHPIGPLADGPYDLTAVAQWTDGGTSDPYPFTVEAIKLATLDKVTDLDGNKIEKNTTTSKTSLYVEGEGKKDEKVEIFNGTDSLGEATVDAAGRYKHPIGPLADGPYDLTAVAQWTDGGTSDPYPFAVKAASNAPTNTRIYDADGNVIADGGDINKSWFIARGDHTPNSVVKIKVNGVIQTKSETTNDEGKWAFFLSDLKVGETYEIIALTEDETAESDPWRVVAQPPSKS